MKKALVIGINKYPFAPLYGCINDAIAIKNQIEKNDDGSSNFAVRIETDTSSKALLKEMISKLFEGDNDIALLYFSGHGIINELGGYLVTPDMKRYDEGVSMTDVLYYANSSNAKNKIVILDCCHSGAMGSFTMVDKESSIINKGVTILTACKKDETSFERNGHGVFTSLLLDALKGGAADIAGNISPGNIYAYIDKSLGPWDQRPTFKTNVTGLISIKTVKPRVSKEIIKKLTTYFPNANQEHSLDPSYEYTNSPDEIHETIQPFAKNDNVTIFKDLQELQSVGLVSPVGELHMYWAAMKSKSCKLTPLGYHYWRLVKDNRI